MGDQDKNPARNRAQTSPQAQRSPRDSRSGDRYAAVFAHMSGMLSIWTPGDDGEFLLSDLNSACERHDRIDRRQALGRPLSEVLPYAAGIGLPEALRSVRDKGETVTLPAQIYKTPFGTGWREYTVFPLPGGEIAALGEDVTENMRARARMHESLDLFSRVFEDAFSVMMLVDPHTGRIVEANAKARDFYGYSRDILKSLRIWDLNTLGEAETRRRMALAQSIQGNLFQARHRLASGELREVEIYSGPVTVLGQDLLYTIIHDVTERHQAEEALRHSEAAMTSIFRAAPVGIGEVANRILGRVNDHLCELTGYSTEELTGHSARVLYPNEDEFQRVGRIKHPEVERTGFGSIEAVFQRKDGALRNVLLSSTWKDDEDKGAGMIFTALDITERKRAAEAERKALRDLHGIVDAMPSAVFCVDHTGRIVLWNSGAENLARRSDLTQLFFDEAVPGLPEFQSLLDTTRSGGEPVVRKAMPMERDGQLTFWDMLIYPLPEGRIGGAAVRLEEVTERIHLEEIMIQSEKMLSLGGLAAGMAHEINNPLGGIMQGAQNIARRMDPGLAANRKAAEALGLSIEQVNEYLDGRGIPKMLDGIRESGQRAAMIVDNMLNFSRGSGSRRAPMDIGNCIERTLELAAHDLNLNARFDFGEVEIVRDFGDLPLVPCTGTELQQVLLNLIINAVHAMAQGGTGDAPPRITLRTRATPHAVQISVADNGPGISPDARQRIFEPFFTTKEPGQGTGLGLSVAYFIVTRNHGGTLTVDSPPDGGARFTITLPLDNDGCGA